MSTKDLAQIIKLLELCFIKSAWLAQDSKVIDLPDLFQVVTASRKSTIYNAVCRSQFSKFEAKERVASIVKHYATLGLPFRWYLGPNDKPSDLLKLLKKQKPNVIYISNGLFLECEGVKLQRNSQIEISALNDSTVEDFVFAETKAWHDEPTAEHLQTCREQALQALASPKRWSYFIARLNGKPVGAARLLLFSDGSAGYLAGGSVHPSFRKLGIYREMVLARIEFLRSRGIPLALTHGLKDSSSVICQRLGFQVICDSAVIEFRNHEKIHRTN